MDIVENENDLASWQCGWQVAYGLPWSEYCSVAKGEGMEHCPEHQADLDQAKADRVAAGLRP